jgi:cytosine/adenosine deaminase-related metal-dependent hydrolase
MILRARFVATMDGPPIEDGAVVVEGESIAAVGTFSDIEGVHQGEIVDLGEQVILPGLINAHCHLDYTCLRGCIPPQKSFTGWIRAINAAKAQLGPDDYINSINHGFAEARRFGTTCVVNLTAFPELVRFVRPLLRTYWMAELIDVRTPGDATDIVYDAAKSLEELPLRGLAPHAPYTASAALYQACQERAVTLTTHLAESREEMSMFRDQTGELYDFIRSINPAFDSGGQTPVAYFLKELDRGQPWLIAHLNELTDDDLALLKKRNPALGIVHCPRSHEFFGHSPFQCDRLKQHFPVSLGTDSLASNQDLNLFAEMRRFQAAFPNTDPKEIISMVTSSPGFACVGRLRAKWHADMIAIPVTGSGKDLFEQIIASEAEPWVMIGGQAGTL